MNEQEGGCGGREREGEKECGGRGGGEREKSGAAADGTGRREERGTARERGKGGGEYTRATDTPPFLLIEIQFERSKPGNSEEIELSRYYREPTIYPRALLVPYIRSRVLYIKPRSSGERAGDRDVS